MKNDVTLRRSVRHHLLWAGGIVGLLVLGLGGWAYLTEISGAIVAQGRVVVDSHTKQVQHRDGGIVREIFVRDGDRVEAGDLLIRLDETLTRANHTAVTKQLAELYALDARLRAERDDRPFINFSREGSDARTVPLSTIEESQIQLMDARATSRNGRREQLQEQIEQFEKQVEGYQAQLVAKEKEIELIGEELVDFQSLHDRQLVKKSQVTALKREKTQLQGRRGSLLASIAQAAEAITERRLQILQVNDDWRTEVLEQLQETRKSIAQLEEQKVAAEDQLIREEIRAPLSGIVHQLTVHSPRGVVGGGEILMLIVPEGDELIVEARIPAVQVDQLSLDQQARVRFPSFNQRTTPELNGRLLHLSADLMIDDRSDVDYYLARLAISEDEMARLQGKTLVPGMPVEVFIETENRTVASYLVKPISDQIAHALRER